jgi:hypothetical protein
VGNLFLDVASGRRHRPSGTRRWGSPGIQGADLPPSTDGAAEMKVEAANEMAKQGLKIKVAKP